MGRTRFGRTRAGLVGAGLVLALAACGSTETYQLDGAVVLRSADAIAFGEQDGQPVCAGDVNSGYADIIGGEDVVVRNGNGEELARTTLAIGQPSADESECSFPWTIAELPEASSYTVTVGGREPVPYTLDELRQDNFEVVLVLSDPA